MPVTKDRRFYLFEEAEKIAAFPAILPKRQLLNAALARFLREESQRLVAMELLELMIEAQAWVGVWDGVLIARIGYRIPIPTVVNGVNGLIRAKHVDGKDVSERQYLLPSPELAAASLWTPPAMKN